MNPWAETEKVVDKICLVCQGTKVWKGEPCFHCMGRGLTPWPERCGHDCQKCNTIPATGVISKFKIGDRFIIDSPGIGGHGQKGVIDEIHYIPCRGFTYHGHLDGGVPYGDNDGNGRVGRFTLKKLGECKKLTDY